MTTGPVPHVGGPILPPAAPTVLINFLPAANVTSMLTCVGPPDIITKGSAGVFINFLPAARLGDMTAHGGVIIVGSPDVIIGEIGAPSPGAGGMGGIVAGLVANKTLPVQQANASVYSTPASGINPKCAAKAAADKKLAADTAARIQKLTGEKSTSSAIQPGESGPQLRPGNWSACQNKAADIAPVMRRFERYNAALPGARAALNASQLGDAAGSKAKSMDCVKRLPDTGPELSKALGLPPDAIKTESLRDDTTGFRAAVYQSESDGKLTLVARDTEPHSLVDWKTNTDNGQGLETDQYREMRKLTSRLQDQGVPFDMAGYSKGGGLAQEAGLINTDGNVYVFNSAGIPAESVGRTATTSMDDLASRTSSFSSQGDFLTYLNTQTDPAKQIQSAEWLKSQLATAGSWYSPLGQPIGLSYLNPAAKSLDDPAFAAQKSSYLDSLQSLIDTSKSNLAAGTPVQLFPPVRTDSAETVPDTMTWLGNQQGATQDAATTGRLVQHQMKIVEGGMEDTNASDRKAMTSFLQQCP